MHSHLLSNLTPITKHRCIYWSQCVKVHYNNLNFPVAGEPAKSLEITLEHLNPIDLKRVNWCKHNFAIVKIWFMLLAKSFRNGISVLARESMRYDHSLTREISEHACPQTHMPCRKHLSLSSPWEMSLNATNLRRASRCKNTSQAIEMSPLTFDVAIRLKRESKEKKNVSAEDLTAAHWKHPTISRSNSSSNQRAHFPFSPPLMCLTWRASPTTAISCQDFIVVGQRKRKGKVPPVFSVEVNRLRAERGRTGNGERASGSQWTVSTWCHVNDCICHSTRLCHSHPCDPSQVHTIEPDFGSGV